MCEWMSQNTRTMPGRSKRTDFDLADGVAAEIEARARESENTLWYVVSLLGKSTVVPATIASTCGTNASLR